ncbi:MAG: hypothetical protein ACI4VP_05605 [Clostridia bacterium]
MKNKLGKWIQYFKTNNIIAIPTDSNTGKGTKDILKKVQELMQEDIEKAALRGRTKKNIRIMILRNTKCRKIFLNQ